MPGDTYFFRCTYVKYIHPFRVDNFSSIRIHEPHRIIGAIRIRTDAVVLLAKGGEAVPSCEDGVVLAGAVVVGVQAERAVELLAVVLVLLEIGAQDHRLQGVHELAAEGVVVHALLHRARRGHRLTHRAQMVLVLVVERELVRRAAGRRLGIAAVEEVLVDLAVPHHQAAAQQVVRRVRALDFRRLQLHLLPDRTGDVRLGRVVHHAVGFLFVDCAYFKHLII